MTTEPRGRGAAANPPNRFEPVELVPEAELPPGEAPAAPETRVYRDAAKTILTSNDSPDVPFDASLNPYRGCEHGCAYCFARPTHEYLGLSAGLDFETKLFAKLDAPALLRRELASPRWTPRVIGVSGVTDPYQPVERRLRLTRGCLEVLAECRNPVAVVTKSRGVVRDADLLSALAGHGAAAVFLSITTLDRGLARELEPRASTPEDRLAAVRELSAAGIPVGVLAAPMIPGLNDHELAAIVAAASAAGARWASFIPLRLPHGVKEVFLDWLERRRPGRRGKVESQLRALRGGRLNDPEFGSRMRGQGPYAEELRALFRLALRKAGLSAGGPRLSAAAFRRPTGPQLELFEGGKDDEVRDEA